MASWLVGCCCEQLDVHRSLHRTVSRRGVLLRADTGDLTVCRWTAVSYHGKHFAAIYNWRNQAV